MATGLLDILGLDPRPKRAHQRDIEKQQLLQKYGLDTLDIQGRQAIELEQTRGNERRKDVSHELSEKQIAALAAKFGIPVEQLASFSNELRNIGAANIGAEQANASAGQNIAQQIASNYGAGSGVATMPTAMQNTLREQQFAIQNQPALKNMATSVGNPGAQLNVDTTSGPARAVATMPYMGEAQKQAVDPLTGLTTTESVKEMQAGLPMVTPEMRAAAEADPRLQGILQGTNIFNRDPAVQPLPNMGGVAATPAPAVTPKMLPPGLQAPDMPTVMAAPPTPQEVEAARKRRDMARLVLPQGGNIRQLFKPGDVGSGGRLTGGGIRTAPQPTEDLGALQQYLIRELSRNPELAKQLGLR